MSNERGKRTSVQTRTASLHDANVTVLSWHEEMVVRMRQGLSEPNNFALEFRGKEDPELNARMALIEANLLAEIYDLGPLADDDVTVDTRVKQSIVDALAKLD